MSANAKTCASDGAPSSLTAALEDSRLKPRNNSNTVRHLLLRHTPFMQMSDPDDQLESSLVIACKSLLHSIRCLRSWSLLTDIFIAQVICSHDPKTNEKQKVSDFGMWTFIKPTDLDTSRKSSDARGDSDGVDGIPAITGNHSGPMGASSPQEDIAPQLTGSTVRFDNVTLTLPNLDV
eukprot:bmy_05831T0